MNLIFTELKITESSDDNFGGNSCFEPLLEPPYQGGSNMGSKYVVVFFFF